MKIEKGKSLEGKRKIFTLKSVKGMFMVVSSTLE